MTTRCRADSTLCCGYETEWVVRAPLRVDAIDAYARRARIMNWSGSLIRELRTDAAHACAWGRLRVSPVPFQIHSEAQGELLMRQD